MMDVRKTQRGPAIAGPRCVFADAAYSTWKSKAFRSSSREELP